MVKHTMIPAIAGCIALSATDSMHAEVFEFGLEGQAGIGLLPGNEVGGAFSTGSGDVLGGIFFDDVTSELTIDVGWGSGNGFTDLTGNAVAMHLHGPADFFQNAGVLYGLDGLPGFDGSATSGGFSGSLTIAAQHVTDLMGGFFYMNVHTPANGGGELRGNLVVIPAPSGLLVLGLGGVSALLRRRRSA